MLPRAMHVTDGNFSYKRAANAGLVNQQEFISNFIIPRQKVDWFQYKVKGRARQGLTDGCDEEDRCNDEEPLVGLDSPGDPTDGQDVKTPCAKNWWAAQEKTEYAGHLWNQWWLSNSLLSWSYWGVLWNSVQRRAVSSSSSSLITNLPTSFQGQVSTSSHRFPAVHLWAWSGIRVWRWVLLWCNCQEQPLAGARCQGQGPSNHWQCLSWLGAQSIVPTQIPSSLSHQYRPGGSWDSQVLFLNLKYNCMYDLTCDEVPLASSCRSALLAVEWREVSRSEYVLHLIICPLYHFNFPPFFYATFSWTTTDMPWKSSRTIHLNFVSSRSASKLMAGC